jgi:serine/threonine protein phosphatase PrpC
MITRAVGLREYVEVDILAVPVQVGDRLLLCSDGLHAYLDSSETLGDLFKLDLREAAPAAIRHANACGGEDNITALFVEFLAGRMAACPTSSARRITMIVSGAIHRCRRGSLPCSSCRRTTSSG